jgi:Skp family chaperone for outer membrane proteins
MKSSHKLLSLIIGAAVASTIGTAAAQAQASAAGSAIGVIDRDRVVAHYPRAQSAAEELKKLEDRLQKTIEEANKKYEEAKKANKPQAELDSLQKHLQGQIDTEGKSFQARVSGLESELEGAVDTAIKAEAAVKNVNVVLLKQAVLMGGVDLTDGVLKRLVASQAAKVSTPTK